MENVRFEPQQLEDEPLGFEGIIGRHPSMEDIFEVIRRVAPTDATVLIAGESPHPIRPGGRAPRLQK